MQSYPGYQPPMYQRVPSCTTMYQPAAPQVYQPPAQQQEIIRVTGMEGARAFPVAPNSRVALFDDGRDVFYIKSADSGGYPTLTAFSFSPLQDTSAPNPDYVTRAEFDELKEMIINAKQPVRKPKAAAPEE